MSLMGLTCALVLTTISDSGIMEAYYRSLLTYGHLGDTKVFLIPDRKTPASLFERCAMLADRGMVILCPALAEQEEFLGKLGNLQGLIPYDSDNRRNIGFLMALEQGVDFVVSIDDDNFCLPDVDFVTEHSVVCRPGEEFVTVGTDSGWFNPCDLLDLDPPYPVYARGFPYRYRHRDAVRMRRRGDRCVIRMNAGLWLGEPDLDALTWLAVPAKARAMKAESVVLDERTWSPVNSQNTGLHRDVIPSYYFVRMGYQLAGGTIDRFGDIFSGYFSQACLKHLGHRVRVGTPLVEHRRNAHDHMLDATRELPAILMVEEVVEWLREAHLEGNSYADVYVSLSYALEDAVERFHGRIWTDEARAYVHRMGYCMRAWVNACRRIM